MPKATASQKRAISNAADKAVENGLTPQQVAILEEEGLGPRQIIREVKALLSSDPSKVVEVNPRGELMLRRKLLPKHLRGVVELSNASAGGIKVRFIDRVAALKLAAEMAKMVNQKSAGNGDVTNQIAAPQAVFVMPGAKYPQLQAPQEEME